ncbi:MAG: hypothetical protein LBI06_01845 [Treponema sp.]|jgi:N-acetylglucosamine kinase-like BadF-type ATPase|nr:hypothetical protein [Treponema sp.]
MSRYVIGVDTGATKSHLAIFDTEGNFVDFGHWGPLNHEVLPGSFDQFEDELGQFVAKILSKNGIGIGQIEYAAFGIAGVDTRAQHGIVSQIIKRLGLQKFTLANDAFLGIPAGSRSGAGICAINGTGCTLAGINKQGDMLQIGGVGIISADVGGGGYLGERAVSSVYSELFRKGEPTCMTPILFEKLGISSKHDFVEKIYEKTDDGTFDIYTCGPLVFDAVKQNDRVASGILLEVAASYAGSISCMIEELKFPPEDELYVVFAGSVFVKGEHPLLLDTLKKGISKDKPAYNIQYVLLDVPNVAGAVIWALNLLNGKCVYYDKVCAQLQERNLG